MSPARSSWANCVAQITVRVPWALLRVRSGLDEDAFARLFVHPLALPGVSVAAVVGNYFRGVAALNAKQSADLEALTAHAVDLLASVISVVSGHHPAGGPAGW